MDFETRSRMVKEWLRKDILPTFTPPSGVDKAKAAQDIADTVNNSLPRVETEGHFTYYLEEVAKRVTRNARSRTLPVPKDFVEACRYATKSRAIEAGTNTWSLCPYQVNAKRIKNKEPVSEYWLSKRGKAELLTHSDLTMEDFFAYPAAHEQEEGDDNNEENGIHRW